MDGDAGADFSQHFGLFEDVDVEASRLKRESGGQASQTTADYCNAGRTRHSLIPLLLGRGQESDDDPHTRPRPSEIPILRGMFS
jgi:hypothetical protein